MSKAPARPQKTVVRIPCRYQELSFLALVTPRFRMNLKPFVDPEVNGGDEKIFPDWLGYYSSSFIVDVFFNLKYDLNTIS